MSAPEHTRDFPREAYLELLRNAPHLFHDRESRREFLAGAGLIDAAAAPRRQNRDTGSAAAVFAGQEAAGEALEDLPGLRFASALVEKLSEPGRLDAALQLARRISAGLHPGYDAQELLHTLERLYLLHRKQVLESGASPDLETYREWVGFEVVHQYSLGDRFFGREQELKELDAWLTSDGAAISVRCLCALGGSGKSALGWHWLTRALPNLQEHGYRGAFWCSFYEKDFDFETFLRRALVFGGRAEQEAVAQLSRTEVETRLLKVLREEPFVIVMDGLERLMNGYAVIFDRAIDPDSIRGGKHEEEVTLHDRRMTDPRNGAFLRELARELASRVLITTRLGPADLQDSSGTREVPHVTFMQLGGLAAEEVIALWKSILETGLNPEVRRIFTVSGNHPLVISILARSVANAGGEWNGWLSLEANKDFALRKGAPEAEIRAQIIGTCMRGLDERAYDVLGVLTTSGRPMTLEVLAGVLQQGSAAAGDERWTSPEQITAELDRLISLGFVGVAEPGGVKEYDVHPVVRGAVWTLITDPRRERFLSLSEFVATPDRDESGIDLNRPTTLFQLLVQSGEIDRAWEMYLNKLWQPLTLRNDYRALLSLVSLLLPEGDALQLVPLRSRREQGSATEVVASLLMSAGDGSRSDKLFRWCGAIRLQTGDFIGFLNARHSRCWQTLYEGRLFQTELDLRAMREEARHFGATEIEPEIECWIGVTLALRGCENEARRLFMKSQYKTGSYRWWAQALAEGYVYLNEPDKALEWLEQAKDTPLASADGKLQEAWERLSRGMAMFQKGEEDEALGELSSALEISLRANYAIIRCFAIPYVAGILLRRGQIEQAEAHLDEYKRVDPDNRYQLSASEACRVRALSSLKRGDRETAKEHASKAYRLAACDGPPFVYKEGLARAIETLRECGGYVPRAESRLDPNWKRLLDEFQGEAPAGEDAAASVSGGEDAGLRVITREEAFEFLEQTALMRQASENDRRWWTAITKEISSTIELPLAEAMEQSGITLESFRNAYEASTHKSVLVVFHQLLAESIVRPATPHPVGELEDAAARAWLENTQEHEQSLTEFLATEFANRVAYPFMIHDLHRDTIGIRAFLADNRRRIDYAGASAAAKTWWDHLERVRPPMDMLILSESIYVSGIPLEGFVREIATGTLRGVEYAFAAIDVKHAIEDFEMKTISRTEGWSDVQILLRLQDVKQKLAWQQAGPEAREFWASVEKNNSHQIARVLQIAEELAIRGATIDDYYQAYLFSNTDDVQANLSYIDYSRLRNEVWDGQPSSWQRVGRPLASEGAGAGFSDTKEWTEHQIRNRLRVLMTRIRQHTATESAGTWWASLEAQHPPAVLLRVAEELHARGATLDELFRAKTAGSTENLPAALAYLNFARVRASAVQRANDLNEVGNTHYENKRFAEAISSYEGAIRARPDSDVFYTNLAGAWEQMPDISGVDAIGHAIQVLERGLKYCPQSARVRNELKAARERKPLIEAGHANAPTLKSLPVSTPLAMEVAGDLEPLLDDLRELMPELRERIRRNTGIMVPDIRFRGNEDLRRGSYLIMVTEVPLVMGNAFPDRRFTTEPESRLNEQGIGTQESSFNPLGGSEGFWISVEETARLGGENLNAAHYLSSHLERVIVRNLSVFVTHESVAARLREEGGAQGREIAAEAALLGRFVRVLRALVDESVPTVAMDPLCTAFLEQARQGANLDETLVALRLLPEILPLLAGRHEGQLLTAGAGIEEEIAAGFHPHGDERILALAPELTQDILSAVRDATGSLTGKAVVVVQNALARRYVRKLVELEFPDLSVISRAELDTHDDRPVEHVIELD